MSERRTVSDEEHAEVVQVIRETVDLAGKRRAAGRSSMPMYVDDVLLLVALAATALDQMRPDLTPSHDQPEGER